MSHSAISDRPRQADPPPDRLSVPYDPPEPTATFARLVEARRRGDRSDLHRLLADLRRLGWAVFAIEPKAGKAVQP